MRRFKIISLVLACALLLTLGCAALSEGGGGTLSELWDSGCQLLFRTDNVTVDGEAVFSLEGERFKTAKLHYVQDGYCSFYGLQLLTPRASGVEQETGWTIIADETGDYAVMEVFHPGIYRSGSDAPQNSLLRRSVQLDALTDLAGWLMGPLESLLPEGTIAVRQEKDGKTVHIALKENQIPDAAASALNVAAAHLSDRWFFHEYVRSFGEEEGLSFESYLTVTEALTAGTVRWTLTGADVDFTLDAQRRLTAAKGNLQVASTYWDGVIRQVEVSFRVAMTEYGASMVHPFDPEDYGVSLPQYRAEEDPEPAAVQVDPEVFEEKLQRAKALLTAQGYAVDPQAEWSGWTDEGSLGISIYASDGEEYFCIFAEDGSLLVLEHRNPDWFMGEEETDGDIPPETLAEIKALVRPFMEDVSPAIAEKADQLQVLSRTVTEDGIQYWILSEDEITGDVLVVLRIAPSLRLEYYSASGDG